MSEVHPNVDTEKKGFCSDTPFMWRQTYLQVGQLIPDLLPTKI